MSKKFVLLSNARSGTTLVMGAMRSHPQFFVHGEIFHERVDWHIRPEFHACNDINKRETDPVGFTKDILSQNFGKDVVGFKIWRSQSNAACDYVLSDPTIVKIILERHNRLAHFSSVLLAQKTQIWAVKGSKKPTDKIRGTKVDFDANNFLNFIKHKEDLFKLYRENAIGTVLHLTYPQAARLEFDEVFAALGVRKFDIAPQTHKQYGDNILDRFEPNCHEQILQTLQQLGKTEWLEEPI